MAAIENQFLMLVHIHNLHMFILFELINLNKESNDCRMSLADYRLDSCCGVV
jgi:hypothetical protein